jgi:hypothetical protein
MKTVVHCTVTVQKDIAMILEGDGYEFDYLGEKLLKEINTNAELYKLKY